MGLLDLVEQEHLVGTAPNGLRELPSRVVTDVAWGGADETRNRVRLGVLGHVEPRHRCFRVEERLGDGLGGLGFADARRAEQEKRSDGAAPMQARRVATQDVGDARERRTVSHDSLPEERLEREHSLGVRLEQPFDRHVGQLGDDLGDGVGVHLSRRTTPSARAGEVENRERLVGQDATREVADRPGDGR